MYHIRSKVGQHSNDLERQFTSKQIALTLCSSMSCPHMANSAASSNQMTCLFDWPNGLPFYICMSFLETKIIMNLFLCTVTIACVTKALAKRATNSHGVLH